MELGHDEYSIEPLNNPHEQEERMDGCEEK